MSDDPQLEDVRGWYIDGRRVHNPFASDATLVAPFDSWLTDHDAEVRRDQREKDARLVAASRRQLAEAIGRETDGEQVIAMLGAVEFAINYPFAVPADPPSKTTAGVTRPHRSS